MTTRVRRRVEKIYPIQTRLLWYTSKAMCFDFPSVPSEPHTWIPREHIHPNTRLHLANDSGTLWVRQWWAENKLGMGGHGR